MSIVNKFTKHDGSWRVEGPCIDAGECVGDYVDVHTSNGVKEVLITRIDIVEAVHPFSKKVKKLKLGVPASKQEEAEYCGTEDYTEEKYPWDEYHW